MASHRISLSSNSTYSVYLNMSKVSFSLILLRRHINYAIYSFDFLFVSLIFIAYFHDEFIANINTSFGFTPAKRLKLIHGYDSYIDPIASSQSLEEFTTLPFVLSEDLFIEFEQNIIGNGDNEKDQIIKEF